MMNDLLIVSESQLHYQALLAMEIKNSTLPLGRTHGA
jgi:hypothetical protein